MAQLVPAHADAAQHVYFGSYYQKLVSNEAEKGVIDEQSDKFGDDDKATIRGVRVVRRNRDEYYKEMPIEWRILKDNGSTYTLLSEKVLEFGNFADFQDSWDTCRLRTWLNDDFYKEAFSAQEQASIVATPVTTKVKSYEEWRTQAEARHITTADKVWLLYEDEVAEGAFGFTDDASRIAYATQYADAKEGASRWWLRGYAGWSYGNQQNTYVAADGTLSSWYQTYDRGVRPAITVAKPAVSTSRPAEAVIRDKKYTVKYKLNGGKGKFEKQVKLQDKGIRLHNRIPKRKSYTFQGWALSKKGKVQYIENSVYKKNKNAKLYAIWKSKKQERTEAKTAKEIYKAAKRNSIAPKKHKKSAISTNGNWAIPEKAIAARYTLPGVGNGYRVPQGICLAGDYVLVSCYNSKGGKRFTSNSEVLVLSKQGEFLTALKLEYKYPTERSEALFSHAGGIAYDPERDMVYIADSNDYLADEKGNVVSDIIWKLPMSQIEYAVDYGGQQSTVALEKAFEAKGVTASTLTYYNGCIYVAAFEQDEEHADRSVMKAWRCNGWAYEEAFGKAVRIPLKTQGIAFKKEGAKTAVYFSTSFNRYKVSKLVKKYAIGKGDVSSLAKASAECALPNMAEGICISGSKLLVVFESGAYGYICDTESGKRAPKTGQRSGAKSSEALFPLNAALALKLSKLKFR